MSSPDGDGWAQINPNGDAAAAVVPLVDGETVTAAFTARLDVNGDLVIAADVDAVVAVDISGYWTPPPVWVPALSYYATTPTVAASSWNGTGTCDGAPCGVLAVGVTKVKVTGVGACRRRGCLR